jgi:hypothetical protein
VLLSRWQQIPSANRQRLLWLLSHLVERQLTVIPIRRTEDGDDADQHDA